MLLEFQAYNVLVIASDIRQLEHIEYTPAPDIHEGAGHYYCQSRICWIFTSFWEIGCKAISSDKDYQMYEAIRLLSIEEAEDTPQEPLLTQWKKAVEDLQYGRISEWHKLETIGGLWNMVDRNCWKS
jgi:phenylalanine-4-hydroxylase